MYGAVEDPANADSAERRWMLEDHREEGRAPSNAPADETSPLKMGGARSLDPLQEKQPGCGRVCCLCQLCCSLPAAITLLVLYTQGNHDEVLVGFLIGTGVLTLIGCCLLCGGLCCPSDDYDDIISLKEATAYVLALEAPVGVPVGTDANGSLADAAMDAKHAPWSTPNGEAPRESTLYERLGVQTSASEARQPLLPRRILPSFPVLLERASGAWSAMGSDLALCAKCTARAF